MLDVGTSSEKPPPLWTEFALEPGDEGDRRRGQHLFIARLQLTANDEVLSLIGGFGHSRHLPDVALHLPSTASVIRSAPTLQNRLQAFLTVIPLDLFALIRLRSAGAAYLDDIYPLHHDAVQHRDGQLGRASPSQKPRFSRVTLLNERGGRGAKAPKGPKTAG
jgi:hypothetical protein